MIHQVKGYLRIIEWIIFIIFLMLSVGYLYQFKTFHSLDSPSHLENARYLKELILQGNGVLKEIYKINPIPYPNFGAHTILAFLLMVFDGFTAVKVLVTIYMCVFCLFFRLIVIKLNPNQLPVISFLAFIWMWSMPVLFGFFNCISSLAFLMFNVWFWLQAKNKSSVSFLIKLTIIFTLTYFTHFFGWIMTLVIIGLFVIKEYWIEKNFKSFFLFGLKYIAAISISFSTFIYVLMRTSEGKGEPLYRPIDESMKALANGNFIPFYFGQPLDTLKPFFFLGFWVLVYVCLVIGSLKAKGLKDYILKNYWFFFSLAILCMYLYLPDGADNVGMATERFCMVIVTFLTFYISTKKINIFIQFYVIYIVFQLINNFKTDYFNTQNEQMIIINQIKEATKLIPEKSTLYNITYPKNWLSLHLESYCNFDKLIIRTQNHQAEAGFFPLLYNESYPSYTLGGVCVNYLPYHYHSKNSPPFTRIDYAIIIYYPLYGTADNVNKDKTCDFIKANGIEVWRSEDVVLYKMKS